MLAVSFGHDEAQDLAHEACCFHCCWDLLVLLGLLDHLALLALLALLDPLLLQVGLDQVRDLG